MTDTARALNYFWGSFSIPAYTEETIPDDAELPYITYTVVEPDWGEKASIQARVWYKGASLVPLNAKVAEIKQAIGEGKSIQTDTGFVVISRDTNFSQYQPYDDEGKSNVKVAYLSAVIHSFTRR